MNFRAIAKLCLSTILLLGVTGFAHADPTFTLNNTNGGDGYVVGSVPAFQLFGSDNSVGSSAATYTAISDSATTESFAWTFISHDCCGSFWDPAGYVLNGVFTQLSTDSTDDLSTSGVVDLSLSAGDEFGWYVSSLDSRGGRGELDITTSVATTPEPSSLILLGSGVLGIAATLRRRMAA